MWLWYLEAFVPQKLGELFRDWWTRASAVVQTRALCWIWMSVGVTQAVTFTCSTSGPWTQRWVTCPSRGIVPSVCLGNISSGMWPYRLTKILTFVYCLLKYHCPSCTIKYKYCNYSSCSQNDTFTACTQCSRSYPVCLGAWCHVTVNVIDFKFRRQTADIHLKNKKLRLKEIVFDWKSRICTHSLALCSRNGGLWEWSATEVFRPPSQVASDWSPASRSHLRSPQSSRSW